MSYQFSLPDTPPSALESASALRELQGTLRKMAEALYGPRDSTLIIYPPRFTNDGPQIRFTPNWDGAFAELSQTAAKHWPAAVYELAHEIIHLLDQTRAGSTWLEEGIAVEFSIMMSAQTHHPMSPKSGSNYDIAVQMTRELYKGNPPAMTQLRRKLGPLSLISVDSLRTLFPGCSISLAEKLTSPFPA